MSTIFIVLIDDNQHQLISYQPGVKNFKPIKLRKKSY